MSDSFEPGQNGPLATQRQYRINARIHIVEQGYEDWDLQNQSHKAVILEPLESTQKNMFFEAWLPSFDEEEAAQFEGAKHYEEIVMRFESPIGIYARGALLLRSKLYPKPHIYMMTAGTSDESKTDVVDELISLGENREVLLTILREDEEMLADLPKNI